MCFCSHACSLQSVWLSSAVEKRVASSEAFARDKVDGRKTTSESLLHKVQQSLVCVDVNSFCVCECVCLCVWHKECWMYAFIFCVNYDGCA